MYNYLIIPKYDDRVSSLIIIMNNISICRFYLLIWLHNGLQLIQIIQILMQYAITYLEWTYTLAFSSSKSLFICGACYGLNNRISIIRHLIICHQWTIQLMIYQYDPLSTSYKCNFTHQITCIVWILLTKQWFYVK